MKPSVFLVDDDQNILTSVSMALEAEGLCVTTCSNGVEALEKIKKKTPDLIVLDIKMPKMDGIETLQKIRDLQDIPVIFLTSKDDEEDELMGLQMGADDYITKPFSQKLLIARIRALLRRNAIRAGQDVPQDKETDEKKVIEHGPLYVDLARHLCRWKGNKIQLTVTEFLLLKALAERPGMVKSRDQLMDAAYDETVYVDDRTVDTHIKRLRKKFKKFDSEFDRIETLYGVGYRFSEDQDQQNI
jgi:two-component system response regulator ChvI